MENLEVFLQFRKRQIEFLKRLNSFFSVDSSFLNYLYNALIMLKELIGYKEVSFWKREKEWLKLVFAIDVETPSGAKEAKIKLGEGIIGRLAKLGYSEVIKDLKDVKEFKNLLGRKTLENLCFYVVPLKDSKKEVIAVLTAGVKGKSTVPESWHIEFLEIVASVMSQHFQIYQSIEKERNTLKKQIKNMEELIYTKTTSFSLNIFSKIEKIAHTDINILLTGESGTGKSHLAKYIHQISHRKEGPFVIINCAAIPRDLLEAELFGYEKGAFTGAVKSKPGKLELANGGTVFLDEIGDLPPELQPKLLHVIQEKQLERIGGDRPISIDVRFIAATNKDLKALIRENKFREDLYYRIAGIEISLPPLRERPDFDKIFEKVFYKLLKNYKKKVEVSEEAYEALKNYHWPGNIRELENVLQIAIALDEDGIIDIQDLPPKIFKKNPKFFKLIDSTVKDIVNELNQIFGENKKVNKDYLKIVKELPNWESLEDLKILVKRSYLMDQDGILTKEDVIKENYEDVPQSEVERTIPSSQTALRNRIAEIEKEEIIKALKKHRWILTRAARELGLTRRQLEYRIKKYGITP